LRVALLQQTSSNWASPALLATLTPSGTVGSNVPAAISVSDNTIGVVNFDSNLCLVLYIFQQPSGGWVDAGETVKYSGSNLGFTGDCTTTRGLPGGFSVSDSVMALQTGSAVEVLDNSAIQPTVDLRATMTLAEGTIGAPAKGRFQITITVTNDDTSATAPSVLLTSAIPSQLSHTSVTSTGGNCGISAVGLKCSFGDFPPGRQETVVLTTTAPTVGSNLSDSATVTSSINPHSLRDTRPILAYATYVAPTAMNVTVTGGYNGSPAGTSITGHLKGSDPHGLPISYELAEVPSNLQVSVSPDGAFQVGAHQDVGPGTYKFTYVANNGYVDSVPATVTVVIDNGGDEGCNVDCGPNVSPVANKGSIGIIADLCLATLLGFGRRRRKNPCEGM
jgi:hypothetical protein